MIKGQRLDSGFEIIDVVDLDELHAAGIWARHKSGAQVFHILNDDSENLFAFAFATAVDNSTGVAHILEHSVLCGSERYPCKDAFPLLEQGSLQTYLNAWTFSDKTVYPSSSVNKQDYFNLMSVYGDAVFHPLLSEFTFMQEGRRFILSGKGKDEKLSITGVVYNEMKGAYSSLDNYAALWSVKSLFPGTIYAWDSGGDPEHIPGLSWEDLRQFHARRYSPANCRIFLAGNIPTEEQLDFINSRFLAGLEPGQAAPPVNPAERWNTSRSVKVPCPMGGDGKAAVFVSWLCGDVKRHEETIALAALTEALLGHDGSPLLRALVESGLGEDICPLSGLDDELRETTFTAGLRGVLPEDAPRVETLILEELRRIAREGFPPGELEAALLSMEFSHMEIRRTSGPFSLVWLRRSLRGWLHGAKPWDTLLLMPGFTALKEKLAANPRCLESLIEELLLNNPHRVLVSVEPQAGFREERERRLEEELSRKKAALSPEDRTTLREKEAALEAHQNREEDPAILASLPHLSRKDLSLELEGAPHSLHEAAGVPFLAHEIFTNGISYAGLAIPVDLLDSEDYPWLPFFTDAVSSVGLPGMNYAEVSSLLARTVGGFYGSLKTGSLGPGAGSGVALPSGIFDLAGRDWIVFYLKCLDEKFAQGLELALRLIREADFSDSRRIRDLALEGKSEAEASLAPGGHHYASCRSARFSSRASAVGEVWNGLGQISFARYLAELDTAEIITRLNRIRDTLAEKGGLIASFTCSPQALAGARRAAELSFRPFSPPGPRNPQSSVPFLAMAKNLAGDSPLSPPENDHGPAGETALPEVFASPSLQIGFAALSLEASPINSRRHGAELALSHHLSTGPLWEEIRMKGGAYGAFAHLNGTERIFGMSTFRDPDPLRSIDSFNAILKNTLTQLRSRQDEEALEKTIVGAYSRETRPRTPAERAAADFTRFLYGLPEDLRRQRIKRLIELQAEELTAALEQLAGQEGKSPVIIAGPETAEKAAKKLGVDVKTLPV
ncbi:MAG: insulinase family protein [Treponema sp.]|jgi:Zn-dependent M16 (insulinase) family peptidase|nr:insulinase family protein [Treponema sp.]